MSMSNETKTPIKETTSYQGLTDISNKIGLENFGIEITEPPKNKKELTIYKKLPVHFRNANHLKHFAKLINRSLTEFTKEIFYKNTNNFDSYLSNIESAVYTEVSTESLYSDEMTSDTNIKEELGRLVPATADEYKEYEINWVGMPEYRQENKTPYKTILFKFDTEQEYNEFAKNIDQKINSNTTSIWHPKLKHENFLIKAWNLPNEQIINPNYPVYIISKGRADTMLTSRALAKMKVNHYIIIEPQDEVLYEKALDNFKIRKYVTLVVAPFSNHGDGPGRARNFAWDHSISIGAKKHWVLDDNIEDFYRLHNNKRIRVRSGIIFKIAEDFIDRYENIPISGFQYRFFIAANSKYPPYVKNTRIYSTLLIANDCKFRWRGRYNEDTDICLRVLKDGDCTVQFNAFLQGKAATQTVKGGNTEEFYHKEGLEKNNWTDGINSEGTTNKSQMLVDMHPDVATMVWKYKRWHHYVDYTSFKKNKLRLKPGLTLPKEKINNYGMEILPIVEESNGNG